MPRTTKSMKTVKKHSRGQTLLFVFLLLLLLTLLGGAVALMWETGLHSLALQKDSMIAFYIAQAGYERAREEVAQQANPKDYESTFSGELNGGTYSVIIGDTGPGKSRKGILSIGRYGAAERRINFNIPKKNMDDADCGNAVHTGCPPYGNAWGYWRRMGNGWSEQ